MTDARTPSDSHQDAQDALVEDRSMRPPNAMGGSQMSASAPGDGHRVSGSEPEHQGRGVDPARADARVSPQLLPAENIALTVALAQMLRGEDPAPNTAAVCVLALARVMGRHDWREDAR